MFPGVLIAEEVDGLGDIAMGDLKTSLETFSNMSLRYASFVEEAFLW